MHSKNLCAKLDLALCMPLAYVSCYDKGDESDFLITGTTECNTAMVTNFQLRVMLRILTDSMLWLNLFSRCR